jgi:hypothetical protein
MTSTALLIETRSGPKLGRRGDLYLDHSHSPVLAPATLAALPSTRAIETHSLPALVRCYPCSFTFYVAFPKRSIPSFATCSMSLLQSLPSSFNLSPLPSCSCFACSGAHC